MSLVLLAPVGVRTFLSLPSAAPVRSAWVDAALRVMKGHDNREWRSIDEVRHTLYRDLDDEEVIARVRRDVRRLHQTTGKARPESASPLLLDFAIVDDYYSRQMTALRARQRHHIARGGNLWLIAVVLSYVFVRIFAKRTRE